MISATDALEQATYDLLTGATGGRRIEGAKVYQHVPEDTPPPVVIIGDMEEEPLGAKKDPDRKISLSIATVTNGEERQPILAIQWQVENLLDSAEVSVEGWTLSFTYLSASANLTGEGDGYVGFSLFEVFALRD